MTEILLHHEKMEEKLNNVSKFSSGDYDCSYDVICNFLDDDSFMILPSDQFKDISNERTLSEQIEPEVNSSDDTLSFHRSTEKSPRNPEEPSRCLESLTSNQKTTCYVFVIQNIKNSKRNELRWLNDDPSLSSSILQMGFAVIKKPGIKKQIHLLIRKKKGCDRQPLQVKLEIIDHSKPPTPFALTVDLIDESAEIVVLPYSFIMFQSKGKKLLDKNGNVVVQCTVDNKDFARLTSRKKKLVGEFCVIIFLILIFLICLYVLFICAFYLKALISFISRVILGFFNILWQFFLTSFV